MFQASGYPKFVDLHTGGFSDCMMKFISGHPYVQVATCLIEYHHMNGSKAGRDLPLRVSRNEKFTRVNNGSFDKISEFNGSKSPNA